MLILDCIVLDNCLECLNSCFCLIVPIVFVDSLILVTLPAKIATNYGYHGIHALNREV